MAVLPSLRPANAMISIAPLLLFCCRSSTVEAAFVGPALSPPIQRRPSPAADPSVASCQYGGGRCTSSISGATTALNQARDDDEQSQQQRQQQQITVSLSSELTPEKVTALYAWVSRALAGDDRYSNLMLALVSVFGNLSPDMEPVRLLEEAMEQLPAEEEPVGTPFSLREREYSSLGAMGAGQWTGQYRTRPHALLDVTDLNNVDEWVKSLPRGCRRTLKKADAQNFTDSALPIKGDEAAPHSTLAHFRCVAEHEVRLLAGGQENADPNYFFDALSVAISRYIETTRMAGEIREYRDGETGEVIAFAHEVTKGRTIRGQWFYANDAASKSYVWFHSVKDLVKRAIENDGVDVVDLGPSGSDAFSELKGRYGFKSVVDWPAVADYLGPFVHADGAKDQTTGGWLRDLLK